MWRWSIWRFWLSHIRNYTTMGRYSVGERQWQSRSMLQHSGSLDSELEHDEYWLWLTRKIVTITVTEKLCEYTRGRWIESSGCFLKMEKVTWSSATTVEVGVYWEDWRDLRWWPRRSTSECVWENLEIPGTRGEVSWVWNTAWMMNYCLGESDLEGGSAGKGFLYCGFGFVYKSIRIPSRTVAGVVRREHDNR